MTLYSPFYCKACANFDAVGLKKNGIFKYYLQKQIVQETNKIY